MNIEIANRLVNLRKEKKLSQEELAERLGISRQAVSKWERAEASPDLDNLIILSKLYGVSLDEILKSDDEEDYSKDGFTETDTETADEAEPRKRTDVHIGLDGIHVTDDTDEVHVGWSGVHINEHGGDTVVVERAGKNVVVDHDGGAVYINGKRADDNDAFHIHKGHGDKRSLIYAFPITLIATVAYLICGIIWHTWHPGWLIFLTIPVFYSVVDAVVKRKVKAFNYPMFAVVVFLSLGFFWGAWAWCWVVFVTIPVFYALCNFFRKLRDPYAVDDDCDDDEDDDYDEDER